MITPSDASVGINILAKAIKALSEGAFDEARELSAGVYASTSDWVPVEDTHIEEDDFEPQITRSLAASIIALADGNHHRGQDAG